MLQRLLIEGVSIRPLNTILEALADIGGSTSDAVTLTEAVRSRLSDWITASLQSDDGRVKVVDLEPELLAWLEARVAAREDGRFLQLEPGERERLKACLLQSMATEQAQNHTVALRVSSKLRAAVFTALGSDIFRVSVVAPKEMSRDAKIETIAILRLADVHYVAA